LMRLCLSQSARSGERVPRQERVEGTCQGLSSAAIRCSLFVGEKSLAVARVSSAMLVSSTVVERFPARGSWRLQRTMVSGGLEKSCGCWSWCVAACFGVPNADEQVTFGNFRDALDQIQEVESRTMEMRTTCSDASNRPYVMKVEKDFRVKAVELCRCLRIRFPGVVRFNGPRFHEREQRGDCLSQSPPKSSSSGAPSTKVVPTTNRGGLEIAESVREPLEIPRRSAITEMIPCVCVPSAASMGRSAAVISTSCS